MTPDPARNRLQATINEKLWATSLLKGQIQEIKRDIMKSKDEGKNDNSLEDRLVSLETDLVTQESALEKLEKEMKSL